MCLLDAVVDWDAARIRCTTRTHHAADNPLRHSGVLAAVCGVEYGAQAAAVHGGLLGATDSRPEAGYLAAVRELRWSVDRLDTVEGDLAVECERLLGEDTRVIYGFALRGAGQELVSGRLSVVLRADGRDP